MAVQQTENRGRADCQAVPQRSWPAGILPVLMPYQAVFPSQCVSQGLFREPVRSARKISGCCGLWRCRADAVSGRSGDVELGGSTPQLLRVIGWALESPTARRTLDGLRYHDDEDATERKETDNCVECLPEQLG